MANADFTTTPHIVCDRCASSADLPHASEHASPDAESHKEESQRLITPLEEALEEEQTQLMLANSLLDACR
jgi:hypothetical protein